MIGNSERSRRRLAFRLLIGLQCLALAPSVSQAQIAQAPADAQSARYGEAQPGVFRVGATITANRGECTNIRAMVAVPLECPEQSVRVLEESISPEVQSVTFRDLQGGARQMLITVPRLANGATATAVVTYEVKTRPILPPEDSVAAELKIPKRIPRDMLRYASVSPTIQARDPKIRSLAREVLEGAGKEADDWTRIEALYDAVLDRIEYVEGPDKSAVETLRDGHADCHGRSALFVALCRASRVPARCVWVQDHCYAEFYLEDSAGEGAWYPAESAGTRAFGEMPLARTILQKGDNFRVPERPKDRLFYATDFLIGLPAPGSGKPTVKYIREQVR